MNNTIYVLMYFDESEMPCPVKILSHHLLGVISNELDMIENQRADSLKFYYVEVRVTTRMSLPRLKH